MSTILAYVDIPERVEPGPGKESVWDYPRPPRVEPTDSRIVVEFAGLTIVDSTGAWRVLETSQPPAYYVPRSDIAMEHFSPTTSHTFCEWKGTASYFTITVADRVVPDAAWTYPDPVPAFEPIKDLLAFYPQAVDACYVDGEKVQANEGRFYGGWITSKVVGPFKGAPGTIGW